jgi:glycosyltransferase involved in cell wall biosynthesis
MSAPDPPTVAVVWTQFAPYHVDRLEAAAAALDGRWRVRGVEMARASGTYAWPPSTPGHGYAHVTLVRDRPVERLVGWARLRRLWPAVRDCRAVALCHYERPETWLLALALRLARRRVILMFETTAWDRPRRRWREAAKRLALAPYQAALVGGAAHESYLRALGWGARPLAHGYDGVAVARLRREADAPAAPDGVPFEARVFLVVARCVPQKNLGTALAAYARYAAAAPGPPRALWICGDGPTRADLEREAARLGLDGCRFLGFQPPTAVARCLARALALLLPSRVEAWGLVVNEALALGVPVLVSDRAGCVPELVADGVRGRVLPPDDVAAWADALAALDRDPAAWRRLASAAAAHAEAGDARHFGTGLAGLLARRP